MSVLLSSTFLIEISIGALFIQILITAFLPFLEPRTPKIFQNYRQKIIAYLRCDNPNATVRYQPLRNSIHTISINRV